MRTNLEIDDVDVAEIEKIPEKRILNVPLPLSEIEIIEYYEWDNNSDIHSKIGHSLDYFISNDNNLLDQDSFLITKSLFAVK